ncbi:hypothetical protein GTU79_26545 [Sodalis ligni]|uniref:hypothetical protein n=1 Tax=Sodalis ligni TaxID=2697027 RepID=UPI001BDE93CC|nr:hypothetical protein [Sodalis ligni]QWA10694.1 hypothetical protein GTU79_26545 [Sodalis ligni]
MNIDSEPIRTNDTAIPESTFLSKSKRGISAIFQRVSNSPLWQDPACRTSFACGALVSTASYAGAKLISSAVYDINELLAPCESVSLQTYCEVMSAGLKYGLSGGILTGLAVAAIIRRNINFINVSEDYDHVKKQLLKMGAAIGLSFGAIAGMLYAIHLQQVHNTDDSHLACSGHPLSSSENSILIFNHFPGERGGVL